MFRFLVGVMVVTMLFLGGDFLLRNYAEGRAGESMKTVLDLKTTPEVRLGGWPFMLKAIGGTFPTVDIHVSDARFRGVELENIEMSLRDVELSFSSLLAGTENAVRTKGGSGSARLSEESLRRALRRQGIPVRISLGDDGSVLIRDERLPEPVRGELVLDGRSLVIRAEGVPQSYILRLPKLVGSLHYESLEVGESSAELIFSLTEGELAVT